MGSAAEWGVGGTEDDATAERGATSALYTQKGGGSEGDVAAWGDARGRAAEGRTTERGRTRGGERTHRSGKCLLCSF